MEKDDILLIEEFVLKNETRLSIMLDTLPIMTLTDDQEELFSRATQIIRQKLQDIKEAEDKSEMKKVLKLKKFLGEYDG